MQGVLREMKVISAPCLTDLMTTMGELIREGWQPHNDWKVVCGHPEELAQLVGNEEIIKNGWTIMCFQTMVNVAPIAQVNPAILKVPGH